MEIGWQHADDTVWLRAELENAADDVRIGAEAARPEVATEDDDVCARRPIVFRKERATEEHVHAECVEELETHTHAAQNFGITILDQHQLGIVVNRHSFEGSTARPPFVDRPLAHTVRMCAGGVDLCQRHDAGWIAVRQLVQQDGLDDAENRRVQPDAQHERQNRIAVRVGAFRSMRTAKRRSCTRISSQRIFRTACHGSFIGSCLL